MFVVVCVVVVVAVFFYSGPASDHADRIKLSFGDRKWSEQSLAGRKAEPRPVASELHFGFKTLLCYMFSASICK